MLSTPTLHGSKLMPLTLAIAVCRPQECVDQGPDSCENVLIFLLSQLHGTLHLAAACTAALTLFIVRAWILLPEQCKTLRRMPLKVQNHRTQRKDPTSESPTDIAMRSAGFSGGQDAPVPERAARRGARESYEG